MQYREGGEQWESYRDEVASQAAPRSTGSEARRQDRRRWTQGYVGPIYTTAINLIILQLDNACLPIYQR